MQQDAEISELEPFEALVGTWTTEATHPALPGTIRGESTFEWLESQPFLIWRSRYDHPEVPDAIALSRDGSDFSQRFTGTFSDDGAPTIAFARSSPLPL